MKPPLGGHFEGMDGRRDIPSDGGFPSPRDQRILGADSTRHPRSLIQKFRADVFGFGKHNREKFQGSG